MARRKTNEDTTTAVERTDTAADEQRPTSRTSKTAGRAMPANTRRGPVWMVPTADGGRVPEDEARR